MVKKIFLAVVGLAMGGIVGALADMMGAGNGAIIAGAALGALVFVIAVPRLKNAG